MGLYGDYFFEIDLEVQNSTHKILVVQGSLHN
jgi:hypothetical protein